MKFIHHVIATTIVCLVIVQVSVVDGGIRRYCGSIRLNHHYNSGSTIALGILFHLWK